MAVASVPGRWSFLVWERAEINSPSKLLYVSVIIGLVVTRRKDAKGLSLTRLWTQTGNVEFSSVQSLSCVWLFATPWTAACQAFLSITNSRSLLKLISNGSMMPSNHLILGHPLRLPSVFPSIRVFFQWVNSLLLSLLWGPALTSVHDYWKNHSFAGRGLFLGSLDGTLWRVPRV